MQLKSNKINEINQTTKGRYYVFSHMQNMDKINYTKVEERLRTRKRTRKTDKGR